MNFISIKYFKLLIIYSLLTGAICAVLSLIPVFMPFFSLFFAPFLGVITPFCLLIFKDGFVEKNIKTCAVLGAISGIAISLAYLIVFIPFVALIHLINNNYYDYGVRFLNLFLFFLVVIMAAIIYALTNSTVALIFSICYNYFKGEKDE